MASIWVESLDRSFEAALDMLAAAVRDCTDELWETSMWQAEAPYQRWSTPWSVAWHALETLDYDLNGEFGPWAPPPPFAGNPHWRTLMTLPAPWSRAEILGYIDHCRQQARNTLAGMPEEKAATPLPVAHRYAGQPYARIITGCVVHTTEHAAQIRQFITAAGIAPAT